VKLDDGLERNVQQQLVISTALDIVLGCSLAITKTTWLGAVEEDSDSTSLLICVEDLEISELYLVGNIAVASWDFGTLPVAIAGAAALAKRVNLGCELLDDSLKLLRVGTLDFVDHLSISEDEEGRQG
jgi:hypothetical protein